MGGFSKTVKLRPVHFDGDEVQITVERLKTEDMVDLSEVLNFDDGATKLTFKDSVQLCQVASKVVPKYVKAVAGLRFEDGTEMTLDEFHTLIPKEFYFMELVGDVLGQLVEVSTVQDHEEKNSESPSDGALKALSKEPPAVLEQVG